VTPAPGKIREECRRLFDQWIVSCTRGGALSRNTVAVGIVSLDHLRQACPASKDNILSPGGEVRGARSGLRSILAKYSIPASYLKEVTTRQGHQDAQRLLDSLDWGQILAGIADEERDRLLVELIGVLAGRAKEWLERQSLKLELDRRQGPVSWISVILEGAQPRSSGIVEQHLVGAKLQTRFPNIEVANHPAHAGDRQTAREGDFAISNTVYHVTAVPSRDVLEKCAANISAGKHPVLLVPSEKQSEAKAIAKYQGIHESLTVLSIEDFVAMNVIELADAEGKGFFAVLQDIIALYNKRLAQVETDLSLQIEVR